MERVAFLIEQTSVRVTCLLNPESVLMTRTAGVKPSRWVGGSLGGVSGSDDPLFYTGGGITELRLDLLFDVALAGSSFVTQDVRDLTSPFWNLAENAGSASDPYMRPPLTTFIWGTSMRMTGIVGAVAERLEHFTADGAPRRSWLRMNMYRAPQGKRNTSIANPTPTQMEKLLETAPNPLSSPPPPDTAGETPPLIHRMLGGDSGPGEPLPLAAYQHYGSPGAWRILAAFNRIADPLRIASGTLLRVPRLTMAAGVTAAEPKRSTEGKT